MSYESLSQEAFDAIVTGELTHLAIWLEDELNALITNYFVSDPDKSGDFRRLLLLRDGLTAQDKIEIARGMLPLLFLSEPDFLKWKGFLKRIEDFKSWRNAMAHGVDVTPAPYAGELIVEVVNRAGSERQIRITPGSHTEMCKQTEDLLDEIRAARLTLES